MPDEPVAWVTFMAGPNAPGLAVLPAGTRFHHSRQAIELETRGETTLSPGDRVEVPLFEVASNPTITLDDALRRFHAVVRGSIRQWPLREAPITADLEGVVFQIVPR